MHRRPHLSGGLPIHDSEAKHKYTKRRATVTALHYIVLLALGLPALWWFTSASSYEHEPTGPKRAPRPRRELEVTPIPRIKAGSLTVKEFYEKYADQTVIVEGEVRGHGGFDLGFQGLRDLCGGTGAFTNVYNPDSDAWGGQSDLKYMNLGDYIDEYMLGEAREDLRYVGGGVGFPYMCPALGPLLPVPSYVSLAIKFADSEVTLEKGDGVNATYRFQSNQPEMFLGPAGTSFFWTMTIDLAV